MANAFNPPGVVRPFGIFSNGALQPPGRVLHVAGQVAWNVDGQVVGKGDMARQTRQVLENVKGVVELRVTEGPEPDSVPANPKH